MFGSTVRRSIQSWFDSNPISLFLQKATDVVATGNWFVDDGNLKSDSTVQYTDTVYFINQSVISNHIIIWLGSTVDTVSHSFYEASTQRDHLKIVVVVVAI